MPDYFDSGDEKPEEKEYKGTVRGSIYDYRQEKTPFQIAVIFVVLLIVGGALIMFYGQNFQGFRTPPYTIVGEGKITAVFRTTRGGVASLAFPLEIYNEQLQKSKPFVPITLSDNATGQEVIVPDYRPYIDPKPFLPVAETLIRGRSDKEFVREVFNMRRQLTTYGEIRALDNITSWPLETLMSTKGTCRDFMVLMASLLEAGNEAGWYKMDIYMTYMDADNPTAPKIPNHVLLRVIYQDGVRECIDSTSTTELCPFETIKGWDFKISRDW